MIELKQRTTSSGCRAEVMRLLLACGRCDEQKEPECAPVVSGWQRCFSNLPPAVCLPEAEGRTIVIGDVEHELQPPLVGRAFGSLDQMRRHALPPRVRGYEQPAHNRETIDRLLQCLLPLRPGPVWVGRREREMAHEIPAVLKDPGSDGAGGSQPADWIVRPVRRVAVSAVDAT